MPDRPTRPPPDLRYGFTPDDRARLRAVCDHSIELVRRARAAVSQSAALLARMDPSVRERVWPPLPPAVDRVV